MARLPTVGGDYGNWGTVLNEYLATAHNADGTLKLDVQTIADLKAIDVAILTDNQQALVAGYYAPGDQGGGVFYYDAAASDADNGGTIVAPNAGSGRWKRAWDGVTANALWFGIRANVSDDQTLILQTAIDVTASLKAALHVPAGIYRVKNLIIRANTTLEGAGRATVFKLLDDSVNWDRLMGSEFGAGYSDVDNVILRDFVTDGNSAQIGLSGNQMHGIACYGEHDNWLIENIHAKDTCGDGIWVTSAVSGTKIPTNITIRRCSAENCGRQDIAIVNVDGCTVSDCSGDGTFDVEANNSAEACRNIVINNLRYNRINIGTLGATVGETQNDAVTASNLNSATDVTVWGVGYGSFSNISCAGLLTVSDCYRCTFTGIVAFHMLVSAVNGRFSRECTFSNALISGGGALDYGVLVSSTMSCSFSQFSITIGNDSSDGIRVQNFSDPGANTTTFTDISIISHTRYGVYIVNAASLSSTRYVFDNLRVLAAGTLPFTYNSANQTGYGELIVRNCIMAGKPVFARVAIADVDGLTILGDYGLDVNFCINPRIYLNNIRFKRATPGTPSISLTGNVDIQELYLGKIEQIPGGTITLSMGTATFAAGVKAWIDGPIVEATTWASTLADANVKEGSMYRLRGSATNWGYTHNGTSWVAKAH